MDKIEQLKKMTKNMAPVEFEKIPKPKEEISFIDNKILKVGCERYVINNIYAFAVSEEQIPTPNSLGVDFVSMLRINNMKAMMFNIKDLKEIESILDKLEKIIIINAG